MIAGALLILKGLALGAAGLVGIGLIPAVWVAYSYYRHCKSYRESDDEPDLLIEGHRR